MKTLSLSLSFFVSAILSLGAKEPAKAWIHLFDGKTTQGWTPRAKVESFEAKDGELRLFSKVNVWVVSDLKMADFEVQTEVKIPLDYKGFNSGLGFRLMLLTGTTYPVESDAASPEIT